MARPLRHQPLDVVAQLVLARPLGRGAHDEAVALGPDLVDDAAQPLALVVVEALGDPEGATSSGTMTTKRPGSDTSWVRRAPLAPIGFFVTWHRIIWPGPQHLLDPRRRARWRVSTSSRS